VGYCSKITGDRRLSREGDRRVAVALPPLEADARGGALQAYEGVIGAILCACVVMKALVGASRVLVTAKPRSGHREAG
jgi:hypothetical protein